MHTNIHTGSDTHTHTYVNTNMQSHTHTHVHTRTHTCTQKRTDSTCTPFHVFGSLFLTVIMHKLTVVYFQSSVNCTGKTMTSFRALLTTQTRQ